MADAGTVEARGAAPAPAILLVDDDIGKCLAIRTILAPLGHPVVEAHPGRDALRAVLRQSFAIILLDVRMATMDGYETAKLIRQRAQTRLTPIILVTAWGTAPHRLMLELTESALIEATAPIVLARLHEMGGRVSIDDFGTGYSSLASLKNLPVDQIKVDQSFIANLATVPGDAVIVRSTIDLAHNLGLTVVAEGVEDQLTLDILIEYGCDSAQGNFFSHALAAEELTPWLTDSPFGVDLGVVAG